MATQRPDFFTVLHNGDGVGHAGTHRPLKVLFAVLQRHALKPTATVQKAHKQPGALHFSGGFEAVEHPFSVQARGPVAERLRQAMEENRARFHVTPEGPDYTPCKRKPLPRHAEVPRGYPSGEELWAKVKPEVERGREGMCQDARTVLGQLAVVDFFRHVGGPTLVFSVPSWWAREVAEEHFAPRFSDLLTRALDKRGVGVSVHFRHEKPWRTTDECLPRFERLRAAARNSREWSAP